MHELGIVFYIIRDVKAIAEENNIKKVASVTIEIGEVSGVVPSYLTDCWVWAIKKEPLLEEAQLKFEIVKAMTICNDCGNVYETIKYAKICPKCNSENTELLIGKDVSIKEIGVI